MLNPHLARWRLHNQRLTRSEFTKPEEVVRWLGAVQAQDYAGAKWGLAQRAPGVTDADIDRAFADGRILRTHVMRPTWHFVAPADLRWLLALTAPRVQAVNRSQYRKLGLDVATLRRSDAALAKALRGGKHLTRDELRSALQHAGVPTEADQRMGYVLMHAELEGLLCSGPRRGKQFTYALLDERAPEKAPFDREAALAELAHRYFTSHGPATAKDFAWWSGLTLADARASIEAASPQLERAVMDEQTYWFSEPAPPKGKSSTAYLLSIYDEYAIGYTDRSAITDPATARALTAMGNDLTAIIVVDGRIAGTWKRTLNTKTVTIVTRLFSELTKAQQRALAAAAQRYGAFLGLAVELN